MSTATLTENTNVLTRTVDNTDPRNFRLCTIDPLEIYGVATAIRNGNAIADHPAFPNPRSTMDRELIDSIKEAGEIMDPVYLYWDASGAVIIVDGKTRLTAVAEYLRENPETEMFRRVPYIRVRPSATGTEADIRLLMVKRNLEDVRRPLSAYDAAVAIDRLEKSGMTEAYIANALNKLGKGGVQYVRSLKAILNANPAVVEAVKAGKIDKVTAKQIAKTVDFKDQADAVNKVTEAVAAGATEAEARKVSGVKKANRTTLGFKDTLEYTIENILKAYWKILEKESADADYEAKIDWNDRAQREAYHNDLIIRTAFEMQMRYMKLDDLSVADQLRYLVEQMTDEQKPILNGCAKIEKLSVLH